MNHMTVDSPDAPWRDTGLYKYCYNGCDLTPCEQEDPCIIDRQPYCDFCAEKIMRLKTYDPVSEKTTKLKKAIEEADYQRLHEQEFDKLNKVKHI